MDEGFLLRNSKFVSGGCFLNSENEDRSDIEGSYGEIDDQDYYPSDEDDLDNEEETKSRFSNYSMTSSVIRRTQG